MAQYVEDARECINTLHEKGKIPIVVGGTGLYINALVDNLSFTEMERLPH